MKIKSRVKTVVILALGLLVPVQAFAQGEDPELLRIWRRVNREAVPYTRRLPSVDKVELQKVGGRGEGGDIRSIAGTKLIAGKQARSIASLWRSQMWNVRFRAMCHEPQYAVKFFSRDRVVLYASVCWDCHNIVILEPTRAGQGFNSDSRAAKALLKFFTSAFPKKTNHSGAR